MGVCLQINAWAGFAPGLAAAGEWLAWAERPALPEGACEVPLPEVPAMLRRRLSPLGRMAVLAGYRCQGDHAGLPIVFASRYGDAGRSLQLLGDFAHDEPMSPTDFALSVHNAIGAMYSIARSDMQASSSVAAGAASAAAGFIEAAGLLSDGAQEVMLVCYDAPLPGDYAGFTNEAAVPYAWAWRLAAPSAGSPSLHLDWEADEDDDSAALPFGLDAMRYAISSDASWERRCGGRRWRWSRHA
jgi:hypothetical protein